MLDELLRVKIQIYFHFLNIYHEERCTVVHLLLIFIKEIRYLFACSLEISHELSGDPYYKRSLFRGISNW